MNEEMRGHLEMEIEHRIRGGLTPAEARRTALADFGGVQRYVEEVRDIRGVTLLEDLVQDARYALRVLGNARGFTVVTVLTVAIGIAATTAVFSIVNAVLLRAPPMAEPDRIFVLAEVWKNGQQSITQNMAQHSYPYPHYIELRDATSSVFSGLAGYRYGTSSVRLRDQARALGSIATSANYFRVLGVRPSLGRLYSDTAEQFGTSMPDVVISHELWQRELGGDSAIVGKTLSVDSRLLEIAGVAPPEFGGTMVGLAADLWMPAAAMVRLPENVRPDQNVRQRAGSLTMFGRLQDGISEQQALAALAAIGRRIRSEPPLQQIERMTLDPIIGPPAMARGPVTGFMGMLFATAAFVLLIAAANIAGMLLARAAQRRREIAVRLSLGAARSRLVRQLLTESVVLCLVGGVTGILLAHWLVGLIPALQAPIGVRVSLAPRVDVLVLSLSLGVAVITGLLTGLTPALQSTRFDLLSGLRGAGQMRQGRSRTAFVVAQLAMSFILLITAGLFTRALRKALEIDPGLDAQNVVIAEVDVAAHGYDRTRAETFYSSLMERLAARREITSAALGQWTPLSFSHMGQGIQLRDGGWVHVIWGIAGPGYLETMRIPVVAGRSFDARDTQNSAPIVIVNETLARRLWPRRSPIGELLRLNATDRTVVGVVRDGKYRSLNEAPAAFALVPIPQYFSRRLTIHARASGDAGAAMSALRAEVARLDPNIAFDQDGALATQLELHSTPQRVAAWVVGVFGLVGLGLAALGVYGVIAYRVAQRTREFGIRFALGAREADIVTTVLHHAFIVIGAAMVIGAPAAVAVARLARGFLYGIPLADPATFVTVAVVLAAVALLACYVPARRAATVDLLVTLRAE